MGKFFNQIVSPLRRGGEGEGGGRGGVSSLASQSSRDDACHLHLSLRTPPRYTPYFQAVKCRHCHRIGRVVSRKCSKAIRYVEQHALVQGTVQ
ncbi:unnamed protein product [Colias eurytheme]|nr:unnamed protein product [Colias eurytheme]